MTPTIFDLFNEHAAAVYDRQNFLGELVSECDWAVDLGAGLLSFGDLYQWEIQVLGSFSESSQTWLWAWANADSPIPDDLIQASLYLRQIGLDQGLTELSQPQLTGDDFAGHFWSVLAVGLCDACAYYRMPYDGGAAYLLIDDADYPVPDFHPLIHLSTTFPPALGAYPISDHVRAFVGHARALGLSIRLEDKTAIVSDDQGGELRATFDEQRRLTGLSGEV